MAEKSNIPAELPIRYFHMAKPTRGRNTEGQLLKKWV